MIVYFVCDWLALKLLQNPTSGYIETNIGLKYFSYKLTIIAQDRKQLLFTLDLEENIMVETQYN